MSAKPTGRPEGAAETEDPSGHETPEERTRELRSKWQRMEMANLAHDFRTPDPFEVLSPVLADGIFKVKRTSAGLRSYLTYMQEKNARPAEAARSEDADEAGEPEPESVDFTDGEAFAKSIMAMRRHLPNAMRWPFVEYAMTVAEARPRCHDGETRAEDALALSWWRATEMARSLQGKGPEEFITPDFNLGYFAAVNGMTADAVIREGRRIKRRVLRGVVDDCAAALAENPEEPAGFKAVLEGALKDAKEALAFLEAEERLYPAAATAPQK